MTTKVVDEKCLIWLSWLLQGALMLLRVHSGFMDPSSLLFSLAEVSDRIGFSFCNQRGGTQKRTRTHTHTQSVKRHCGQPAAEGKCTFHFDRFVS